MNLIVRRIVAGSMVSCLLLGLATTSPAGNGRSGGNNNNNNNNGGNIFRPQNNNGFRPQNNNVFRPQNNNVFKPQNNNVFKPQNNNVIKPQNTNVFKPQNNNVFKPQNNNVFKPQNNNVFKPQNTNVFKPQNNTVLKPNNLIINKPNTGNNVFNNGGKNIFNNGGKPVINNGGKFVNNNGVNNGGKKQYPGWNPLVVGPKPNKPNWIKPQGGGNGNKYVWKKNNNVVNGLVTIGIINSVAGLVIPLANNNWNRPGWRPRPYYPGYVVDGGVVDQGVVDPGVVDGQALADVGSEATPFSGGEIKISAGLDMPGEIGYVLNGTPFEMKPGYSQKFAEDRTWIIQFRSGDEASDVVEYTLTAGAYRFVVLDGKLNLSPTTAPPEGGSPVNPEVLQQNTLPQQSSAPAIAPQEFNADGSLSGPPATP